MHVDVAIYLGERKGRSCSAEPLKNERAQIRSHSDQIRSNHIRIRSDQITNHIPHSVTYLILNSPG